MTPVHIAALYFDDRKEATKKRLQKLKEAGLVGERTRNAFELSVLFLARHGLAVLNEHKILSEYPAFNMPALDRRAHVSALTVRHELEVMDVKVAFYSAIRDVDRLTIEEFSTWPLLYQFQVLRPGMRGGGATVKPDGFIRIHEETTDGHVDEHPFFLEVDLSSETQDRLARKAISYLNYYQSGGFAARHGASRADFKDYPFRVLMVLKNAERRNNTAERLLQNNPPIFKQVYLSTLGEVKSNPFGAIWIRPMDYRDATKGTQFASQDRPQTWAYRRQGERDRFVESEISKFPLLNPPDSTSR
jgi:protein involved in plasmid replication-relaxation